MADLESNKAVEATSAPADEATQVTQPLLSSEPREGVQDSFAQQAISQTFKSTACLANLLPTGTVLAFQLLSPIFTNQGSCDSVGQFMTAELIGLCGLSCLILSFTDSFKDDKGVVRYGLATFKGLWIIDGSQPLPADKAVTYRVKFIDFIHAFMSLLVFTAIALFDNNVVSCFYPVPSTQMKEILQSLPVGIGVMSSMMFVVFPTTRHGIGFPIAHD